MSNVENNTNEYRLKVSETAKDFLLLYDDVAYGIGDPSGIELINAALVDARGMSASWRTVCKMPSSRTRARPSEESAQRADRRHLQSR